MTAPRHSRRCKTIIPAASLVLALTSTLLAQPAGELERGFRQPPASARPWVYWFWLNGNITKEGITADLEAMQKVGIGGVLIMEVDQGAPLGPVGFMSEQWRELFKHVVAEAERLGLEVNMNNDAGWNGSGGPWIKPSESMQKVVWTETDVEGPKRLEAMLSQPQAVAGYYRDIAVLAVPTPGPYRIENIKVKACYDMGGGAVPIVNQEPPKEMVIDRERVTEITAHMDKTGLLAWDVPAGKWTVLRFGHTSTGVENAPAPASGRGLECDKLSREGIEANFAGMMAKLIADSAGRAGAGKTLVTTHIDSWENGAQNWTARMREEFKQRRGYDPLPFLPAMTGRVVGGLEISERFLWDLRQTISDLVVENYAGHMQTLAARHGLRLSIEGYYAPCHELTYVARADEPMAEFWMGGGAMETLKHMASAVHTYGKPILGAEAFTAADQERWLDHPGSIKALGDRAFAAGVNRFVFHRYAMQPWLNRRPGMTMGPWGLHYERTNTWWDWSADWHQYLARCQYLLRQGRFVADICYLQPELAPQSAARHPKLRYDYDDVSPEVVLTRMSVKDGRLVLPDGMSYRLMVLPDVPTMTPGLLKKIKELVEAGATVVGPRPVKSPSLTDYPRADAEVKRLAEALWGDCDGKMLTEHKVGLGRVVCGVTPDRVLAETGVRPDFSGPSTLCCIHRTTSDADMYFVANPQRVRVEAACTFRVKGRKPEFWWPEVGRTETAASFVEQDGGTTVLLALEPNGSVFVVFRESDSKPDPVLAVSRDGKPLWSLRDPPVRLVVRSARYGVLNDPQRTRDVREKVQQMADRGELEFQVARLAEGDDPAYLTVKTVEIEYTVGDRRFVVRGQDPSTIYLRGEVPVILIEKAVYGVLGDEKRTRDVKAKLQQLVDAGQGSFEVAQLAKGDDPAYGVVKTLQVEYTINGRRATASGTDPETVDLVPPRGAQRVAEVRLRRDGLRLFAWHPGRYELKTVSGKVHPVAVDLPAPVELAGAWKVEFPAGSGAPPSITLETLISLSEHPEPGVKYFSGVATYTKKINIPEHLLGQDRRLQLDLGDVQVMADVKLNGKPLGIEWRAPYASDITHVAKPGENELEVRTVNLWPNRMVGDEQLPEDSKRHPNGTLQEWPAWLAEGKPSPSGRLTFTTWRLWKKDSPLPKSGLIGPVMLRPAIVSTIKG